MTTWAIVPVKRFADSKRRLAAVLEPAQRRRLAMAMLRHVLATLSAVRGLDAVALATSEPAAEAFGVPVIDDAGGGLNAAIVRAAISTQAAGASRMLVVAADLPLASAEDIEGILTSAPNVPVVIVPDAIGQGTNALLLTPPQVLAPCFGETSRARHVAAARNLGLAHRELDLPSIAFDVDEPGDLDRLTIQMGGRSAYHFLVRDVETAE